MSYTRLLYHVIIRTKRSERTIVEEHERDLYAYIYGAIGEMQGKLYRIGGMPDHLHLLVGIPSTVSVTSFIRELKISSSKWLTINPNFPKFDGWGQSFAAFSYNYNDKETIINYIKSQKEHHKHMSFGEELREFLNENNVHVDEKYLPK